MVTTDSTSDSVLIPTLAIMYQDGKTFVQLQDDNKDRQPQQVTLGIQNKFQAEVIEGVQAGDVIKASVLEEELLEEMGIDDTSNSMFGG
jgi:multidrug efflux pump subunit AcrA (membrane-fusion protein)